MTFSFAHCAVAGGAIRRHHRAAAFSLVELLTVMFIMTLLIGILIPSLGAARNAAKKAKTRSDIRAIGAALDLFKNDNERDFPHTNGYPPSFAHPPFPGWDDFKPHLGEFPFLEDKPVVYGAHWLPAMLMGVDNLGYVTKSSVPPNLRSEPWKWYADDPYEDGTNKPLPRATLYIEPDSVRTVPTQMVRGRQPPDMSTLFPNWEHMKNLPVMVDAFEQPILYYAANTHGRTTNMVEDVHREDNLYTGGVQEEGPPYYFHQDNAGFTGTGSHDLREITGWNLGGGEHKIAKSGHELGARRLVLQEPDSFAHFILDPTQRRFLEMKHASGGDLPDNAPLKPVNPDGFLLISAGADNIYGTTDDVTNFPLSAE